MKKSSDETDDLSILKPLTNGEYISDEELVKYQKLARCGLVRFGTESTMTEDGRIKFLRTGKLSMLGKFISKFKGKM
jgi:hypothetical protein